MSGDLERIVKLAELLREQQDKFDQLTEQTKTAKKDLMRTERDDLPTLMTELGLTEIKLKDGSVVSINPEVDVSINKNRKDEALTWLNENGFGGLIKTNVTITFDKGDHEKALQAFEALSGNYDGAELAENVHPATLKAFVKEQMADGHPVPTEFFNVFPYDKAKIK